MSRSDRATPLVAAFFVLLWLGCRDMLRRVDDNLWTED